MNVSPPTWASVAAVSLACVGIVAVCEYVRRAMHHDKGGGGSRKGSR